MTTRPDPARTGVPLNPEKDGWHWFVRGNFYSAALWHRGHFSFLDTTIWPEEFLQLDIIYAGPVLTPDEVQNLRDDLASSERERAHQHGRADRNAAEYAREQGNREALQKRVAELEGALRKIQNLARTGRPHPMSRKVDYFQIAAAALTGGKS